MARPRLETPSIVYQIKLRLRPGEDDDLIAFMQAIPERLRVAAVKQALRAGGMSVQLAELPSDADVECALDALLG